MTAATIHIDHLSIHLQTPSADARQRAPLTSPPPPASEGTVYDASTCLMWSKSTNAEGKTWAQAKEAAAAVRLGGFTDWRLPTRAELLTLVDDTRSNPAIDTDRFDCAASWYWSATPLASSPSVYAWLVNFYNGYAFYYHQGNDGRVRAVRSVSPSASGQ